ncbi:hypothetical protein V2G26_005725 [Clonostachys chloroleuca]
MQAPNALHSTLGRILFRSPGHSHHSSTQPAAIFCAPTAWSSGAAGRGSVSRPAPEIRPPSDEQVPGQGRSRQLAHCSWAGKWMATEWSEVREASQMTSRPGALIPRQSCRRRRSQR